MPSQDYSLRAKDYSKKQTQLKNLRKKALDRNEDEFYFGMHSRKGPGSALTRGKGFTGKVEGDRGNEGMGVDAVRLLKTQDVAYVRTVGNGFAKEVEALRERVVLARGALGENEGEKIVFAEGVEERDSVVRGMGGEEDEDEDEDKAEEKEVKLEKLERRLEVAEEKLAAVRRVERQLEVQQAKMAKTATSGGTTRKGKKLMVRKRKR